MPRTALLTDALRGRGNALVFAGAAAALIGAGAASAATVAPSASHPTALSRTESVQVRALDAASTRGSGSLALRAPAASHTAVAVPAHAHGASVAPRPAAHVQLASSVRPHAKAAAAKPYQIYDSVTPSQIPAGHEVATYADGGYAVSPAAVHGKHVLWIDTNGSDPKGATALDVEPGDATPSGAAAWAKAKLTAEPKSTAIIYTMRSDWAAAKAAVAALPGSMPRHVQWWIADPTGTPHIVPGAAATQWYWGSNYDITAATPGFWTAR